MAIGSMEGRIWEYQSACGDLRGEDEKRSLAPYLIGIGKKGFEIRNA